MHGVTHRNTKLSVYPGLDNLTICNDCDVLMRQVKEKLDKCHTREERIQLLTLIPEHWSRERAVSFFNVTEYMVRTARNVEWCWHIRRGGYLMMMLNYKGGRGIKNLGKSDYIISECS